MFRLRITLYVNIDTDLKIKFFSPYSEAELDVPLSSPPPSLSPVLQTVLFTRTRPAVPPMDLPLRELYSDDTAGSLSDILAERTESLLGVRRGGRLPAEQSTPLVKQGTGK